MRFRLIPGALLFVAPFFTGQSDASSAPSFIDAVAQAPALDAARKRAEAARERIAGSGRFPDVQVEGMYSQVRQPMGGEQFPMWEVAVSQPLPKAGERTADRERALAAANMAAADYAVMRGEIAAEVAIALADSDAARDRAVALTRQLARTEQLLSALDARVATGSSRLPDRLALQTRLASMRLMIEQEQRMAEDGVAFVRGMLGLPTGARLPPFAAPDPTAINPDDSPLLAASSARVAEARAMVKMARASARPMTSVRLRFEREEQRIGSMDTIGVAFMTELPFRSRGYARADQSAARADEAAARADGTAARHRIAAALARAERAERLAHSTRRLISETASRLDAEYDALARSNDLTVTVAVDVLDRLNDAELQGITADAAARTARAELWRYAPLR